MIEKSVLMMVLLFMPKCRGFHTSLAVPQVTVLNSYLCFNMDKEPAPVAKDDEMGRQMQDMSGLFNFKNMSKHLRAYYRYNSK